MTKENSEPDFTSIFSEMINQELNQNSENTEPALEVSHNKKKHIDISKL